MELQIYGYSGGMQSNMTYVPGMRDDFTLNNYYHDEGLIDDSVKGNRLHRNRDNSLELIPKNPIAGIGKKLISPLLGSSIELSIRTYRVVRQGFSAMDNLFSKALNILPGAHAQGIIQKTWNNLIAVSDNSRANFAQCLETSVENYRKILTQGGQQSDPALIQSANLIGGRLIRVCEDEHSKKTHEALYIQYKEEYERWEKKRDKFLEECKKKHGGDETCYLDLSPEYQNPALFQSDHLESQDATSYTSRRVWESREGYMYCKIYVNRWGFDTVYETAVYNYDVKTGKPTNNAGSSNKGGN